MVNLISHGQKVVEVWVRHPELDVPQNKEQKKEDVPQEKNEQTAEKGPPFIMSPDGETGHKTWSTTKWYRGKTWKCESIQMEITGDKVNEVWNRKPALDMPARVPQVNEVCFANELADDALADKAAMKKAAQKTMKKAVMKRPMMKKAVMKVAKKGRAMKGSAMKGSAMKKSASSSSSSSS